MMPLFLALALSLLVGVTLGMLGGGGSILTLPILRYVLGLGVREAIAASLVIVGMTSLAGMLAHARAGRVRWSLGLLYGAASMTGAYVAGRWISPRLPAGVLLVVFGLLMAATALAMLRRKTPQVRPDDAAAPHAARHAAPNAASPNAAAPKIARILAVGLATGSLTGLVGAGGGFVVLPALTLLAGLPMPEAIGTSLLVIAVNTVAAFAGNAGHIAIAWPSTLGLALMAVGGSMLGAKVAGRISPARLRLAFAWLVVAMASFMLLQEVPRLLHVALPMGAVLAGAAAITALGMLLHKYLTRQAATAVPTLA